MIKEYHWSAKPNFGDLLTPLLIDRFIHLPHIQASPQEANLVIVGSILEHIPNNWDNAWNGVIAGAGFLHENSKMVVKRKVLAVRGPMTASRILTSSTGCAFKKYEGVLADPGLIADELVPEQIKQYNLGIVPHWTDTSLALNPIFKKFNPLIINVADDPLKVIAQIGQCKKIVSSSLHGIILADAFGIPRRIELSPRALSHPQQEGGTFKWRDYSASINMKFETGITQEPDRNIIIEKQHELFDVLTEVKSIFS
jgi:pyruvyltransferase